MPDLLAVLRDALADRYAVERELGRGGMATVFLAEDLKHRRPVAIKVLHPDLAAAVGADRFLREIEVAARLQHPHILPLYDSGAAAGFLYYVMPYVEGESLRDRLEREKQLSLEDTLRIAGEVAGALAYAHSHGGVHRDIKPENVMLSGGTAVVTDFGIARAVTAAGDEHQLTQTGTVIGTPAYMSPEQATGSAEIDGRSDQYSLACVVYEMLVGEPPFTGPTAQAVMARHSLDFVSPPSIVRASIPDAVEDALLRALAKTPADRFPTATLFAEGLARPSPATGPMRRLTRPTRAPRRWLEIPPAVVVALGVIVLGVTAVATRSLWSGAGRSRGAGAAEGGLDPRHVAVLYFADLSPKRDLGYLADGLTEALIDELTRITSLQVISRNGVAPYREAEVSPDSVARALSAGTIVKGSVEEAGDRYHVSVRLIEGATGADFRRASFEQPKGSLLGIRNAVAPKVAEFLRERLGEEVRLREQRAGTSNVAAWVVLERAEKTRKDAEALLKADSMEAAARASQLADSLAARAGALDPQWSEPIVLRAAISYRQSRLDVNPAHAQPWIEKGLTFAAQALKLDAKNPAALELRGELRYRQYLLRLTPTPAAATQLLTDAEADLRESVRLAPERAGAWSTLSHLSYQKPDYVEAKIDAQRAYEADAYLSVADQILYQLFTTSYDLEQFADAIRWCEEGQRRFPEKPGFASCQLWLMTSEAKQPDVALAWKLFETLGKRTPPSLWPFGRLQAQIGVAAVVARAGLADSARRVLAQSQGGPDVDPEGELLSFQAFAYLLLGDRDTALRLLKQQVAANPAHRVGLTRSNHWWWRDIRGDPRFREIIGTGK